jgi:hypothetical protein
MKKKLVTTLLALCMLLSLLPMGVLAANHTTNNAYTADLSVCSTEQLQKMTLGTFMANVKDSTGNALTGVSSASWSVNGSTNYNYAKDADAVMDLRNAKSVTLIPGKQLDSSTVYEIKVSRTADDLFSNLSLTGATVTNVYSNGNSNGANYYINVSDSVYDGAQFTLSFTVKQYTGYTAAVYAGNYSTAEDAEASGSPLSGTATVGFYDNYFTLIYTAADGSKSVKSIDVHVQGVFKGYSTKEALNNADGNSVVYMNVANPSNVNGTWVYSYILNSGNSLNGTYYFKVTCTYYDGTGTGSTSDAITSAIMDGTTDVTSDMQGSGYAADYSGSGHSFVITTENGATHKYSVSVAGVVEAAYQSGNGVSAIDLSGDPYFQAETVVGTDAGNTPVNVPAYVMSSNMDSMYNQSENSWQTVILNPAAGTAINYSALKPVFYVYKNTDAYAPTSAGAVASVITSGNTPIDYSNHTVEFTARDKTPGITNTFIKNYWVTYVSATATGSGNLFVNGPSYATEQSGAKETREVNLTGTDDFHDVFIANIGDAALTNVKAELGGGAESLLKLDTYYTAGGAADETLGAFNTSGSGNTGRIRLSLIADPTAATTITGYLKLTASSGQVRYVYLSGTAAPGLATDSMPNAVKYVPYQKLFQTTNHNDTVSVSYSIAGDVPAWATFNGSTGEFYGVPTETGTYTFTVTASFSGGYSTSKEYTLTVDENTDVNVLKNNQPIIDYVPDTLDSYTDQEFTVNHVFDEFTKFFIDGQLLTLNKDYSAEKGSTRITIYGQTFAKFGSDKHTIAAEFRTGIVMTKASQNYKSTATGRGISGHSSNNNNGKDYQPLTPATPVIYVDINASNWFYDDVMWAYNNNYMNGVGNSKFDPFSHISQGMIVTLLARMAKADLSQYAGTSYTDIPVGRWYSAAASWARANGLIAQTGFSPNAAMTRGQLAVVLAKYVDLMKMEHTAGAAVAFADASAMTADENAAFQTLNSMGIMKGVGNNKMNVAGTASRAEMAAIAHRIVNYAEVHTSAK